MKLNDLAIIIVLLIIISLILSAFDISPIALTNVLAYSLLIIGVAVVYIETIKQNRFSVFIGSIIFLFGVYFLITENFNLNIPEDFYIPLILIFGGTGLLMLYIGIATRKIFLFISIIFLTAGITLIIVKSHCGVVTFVHSFLPVLNFLWPMLIVFLLLIFLMRVK
jgi:hypothetical protein